MMRAPIRRAVLGSCMGLLLCAGSAMAEDYKWGAFSVDTSDATKEPFYGIGGGETEQEASDNAKSFCVEAGGKECTLAVTYEQCGALAGNGHSIGWGKAPTKEEAESQAMAGCKDGGCEIISSDCNQ